MASLIVLSSDESEDDDDIEVVGEVKGEPDGDVIFLSIEKTEAEEPVDLTCSTSDTKVDADSAVMAPSSESGRTADEVDGDTIKTSCDSAIKRNQTTNSDSVQTINLSCDVDTNKSVSTCNTALDQLKGSVGNQRPSIISCPTSLSVKDSTSPSVIDPNVDAGSSKQKISDLSERESKQSTTNLMHDQVLSDTGNPVSNSAKDKDTTLQLCDKSKSSGLVLDAPISVNNGLSVNLCSSTSYDLTRGAMGFNEDTCSIKIMDTTNHYSNKPNFGRSVSAISTYQSDLLPQPQLITPKIPGVTDLSQSCWDSGTSASLSDNINKNIPSRKRLKSDNSLSDKFSCSNPMFLAAVPARNTNVPIDSRNKLSVGENDLRQMSFGSGITACCMCKEQGRKVSCCMMGHQTCGMCLEEGVKNILCDQNRKILMCFYVGCDSFYPISQLKQTLPAIVVEILETHIENHYINCAEDMLMSELSGQAMVRSESKPQPPAAPDPAQPMEENPVAAPSKSSDLPECWMEMDPNTPFILVKLEPETEAYVTVSVKFHETMPFGTMDIEEICRVQNPFLWKFYSVKAEQMKNENCGESVEERLLFHGTNDTSMEAICKSGFDWRLCGKNGTLYGQALTNVCGRRIPWMLQGSYFAQTACYSHQYSAKNRSAGRGGSFKLTNQLISSTSNAKVWFPRKNQAPVLIPNLASIVSSGISSTNYTLGNPLSSNSLGSSNANSIFVNPPVNSNLGSSITNNNVVNMATNNNLGNSVPSNSLAYPIANNALGNPIANNSLGNSIANNALGNPMANNSLGNPIPNDALGNPVANNALGNPIINNTVGNPAANNSLGISIANNNMGGCNANNNLGTNSNLGNTNTSLCNSVTSTQSNVPSPHVPPRPGNNLFSIWQYISDNSLLQNNNSSVPVNPISIAVSTSSSSTGSIVSQSYNGMTVPTIPQPSTSFYPNPLNLTTALSASNPGPSPNVVLPTVSGKRYKRKRKASPKSSSASGFVYSPTVSTNYGLNSSGTDMSDKPLYKMFCARVLVGNYTRGKESFRKPPEMIPDEPYGKCYDSCVDNELAPKIFVVFDHAQAYPEYIISYRCLSDNSK